MQQHTKEEPPSHAFEVNYKEHRLEQYHKNAGHDHVYKFHKHEQTHTIHIITDAKKLSAAHSNAIEHFLLIGRNYGKFVESPNNQRPNRQKALLIFFPGETCTKGCCRCCSLSLSSHSTQTGNLCCSITRLIWLLLGPGSVIAENVR